MDDRQKLKLEMEIEVSLKQSESIKRLVDVLYSDIISNNAKKQYKDEY